MKVLQEVLKCSPPSRIERPRHSEVPSLFANPPCALQNIPFSESKSTLFDPRLGAHSNGRFMARLWEHLKGGIEIPQASLQSKRWNVLIFLIVGSLEGRQGRNTMWLIDDLQMNERDRPFQFFLCHHKNGAGCFCRLLKIYLLKTVGVMRKVGHLVQLRKIKLCCSPCCHSHARNVDPCEDLGSEKLKGSGRALSSLTVA